MLEKKMPFGHPSLDGVTDLTHGKLRWWVNRSNVEDEMMWACIEDRKTKMQAISIHNALSETVNLVTWDFLFHIT